MTLDLGARCVDGVVIVADKKITDLTTRLLVKYDEKVYGVLRNVTFARVQKICLKCFLDM